MNKLVDLTHWKNSLEKGQTPSGGASWNATLVLCEVIGQTKSHTWTPYVAVPLMYCSFHRAAPPPQWVMWQGTWNGVKVIRPVLIYLLKPSWAANNYNITYVMYDDVYLVGVSCLTVVKIHPTPFNEKDMRRLPSWTVIDNVVFRWPFSVSSVHIHWW